MQPGEAREGGAQAAGARPQHDLGRCCRGPRENPRPGAPTHGPFTRSERGSSSVVRTLMTHPGGGGAWPSVLGLVSEILPRLRRATGVGWGTPSPGRCWPVRGFSQTHLLPAGGTGGACSRSAAPGGRVCSSPGAGLLSSPAGSTGQGRGHLQGCCWRRGRVRTRCGSVQSPSMPGRPPCLCPSAGGSLEAAEFRTRQRLLRGGGCACRCALSTCQGYCSGRPSLVRRSVRAQLHALGHRGLPVPPSGSQQGCRDAFEPWRALSTGAVSHMTVQLLGFGGQCVPETASGGE